MPRMPPINGTGVLAGLTDIPWASLRHAYGPAGDVPGILRAILDGDQKTAKEAASELFGNIWHQGTVYQATAPAVPFLARLAAAGCRTATLAGLLGCIAESTDESGIEPGSARAAVTAQADLLLPLLAAPDAEVRARTAWAVAQCPDMPGLIQALRDQWASEAGPAWLAEGLDPAKNNWNDEEPFPGLLRDLAARGDLAVAVELAVTAIDQARDPGARKAAIWAAEKLALDYRVPPAALAGVLARQAADSAAGLGALSLLQQLDPVLSTADAVFTVADRPGPDRTADEALACL
jgi:hypothetical protein